jgi:hypothetical protein
MRTVVQMQVVRKVFGGRRSGVVALDGVPAGPCGPCGFALRFRPVMAAAGPA